MEKPAEKQAFTLIYGEYVDDRLHIQAPQARFERATV
jgi:hypothetical protein